MPGKALGLSALAVLGLTASAASGDATIVLDFTHDTFFQSNSTALAALNAAANDVSAALTSSLSATADTAFGSSGTSNVTVDEDDLDDLRAEVREGLRDRIRNLTADESESFEELLSDPKRKRR